MGDSSYVLLRKIRDQHMTEFGREFNLDTIDALRAIRELIASIRAEARAEAALAKQETEAIIYAIITTIGGTVEGHPTNRLNYLQRLRELVRIERASILADEPKERDSREGLPYKSDVDDRG